MAYIQVPGSMPCMTYDFPVKVQPWEFGSSPMELGGVVRGKTNEVLRFFFVFLNLCSSAFIRVPLGL
jgi:hypothetical protein